MNAEQMVCAHCPCYWSGRAPLFASWPAADGICCACRRVNKTDEVAS